MNYKVTKEQGITLVALIITIIILIILATVSIKAVLDMNFVDLASNAVLNYAEAQAEEDKSMNDIDSFLQSTIKKIENNDFNTGEGDNPTPTIEPTPEPGKNPGGVITDITTTQDWIDLSGFREADSKKLGLKFNFCSLEDKILQYSDTIARGGRHLHRFPVKTGITSVKQIPITSELESRLT